MPAVRQTDLFLGLFAQGTLRLELVDFAVESAHSFLQLVLSDPQFQLLLASFVV